MDRIYVAFVETEASKVARGGKYRYGVSAYIDVPRGMGLREQQRYIRAQMARVLAGETEGASDSAAQGKPTDPSLYRVVAHALSGQQQ